MICRAPFQAQPFCDSLNVKSKMAYKFCVPLLIQLFNHCLAWDLIHHFLDQCVCLYQVLVSLVFVGFVLMLSVHLSCCFFCRFVISDMELVTRQCYATGSSTSCCFCPCLKRKEGWKRCLHPSPFSATREVVEKGLGELLSLVFRGANREQQWWETVL